jgi:hypothetical protein
MKSEIGLGASMQIEPSKKEPIIDERAAALRQIEELLSVLTDPNARRSRARSLAITKLEEAAMWLNADV